MEGHGLRPGGPRHPDPAYAAQIQEEISSAAAGGRLPLAILLFAIVFSIFGLVMQAVTTRLLKFKVQAVG